MSRVALSILAVISLATPALAEEKSRFADLPAGTLIGSGRLKIAVTPPEQFRSSPPFEVSNVLYLNRCSGGCNVTGGTINDARQHISTYIAPGPHVVTEYQNNAKQIGSAADAEWNAIVQCVKEIYSPFNIVVTDTPPAAGSGNYTEAIVGGVSEDVGLMSSGANGVGGVAPAHTSCSPNDNAMSYTFANNSYYFYSASLAQYRIWEICSIVGQESAHHYGLDHSYEFFDGTSGCNDPMTYRVDCGGQKFFRNKAAKCGESSVRECSCGGLQNTHAKILGVFGAGTSLIPPPTVQITSPANGGTATNGQVVSFMAGSKRGVEKSELWLNGYNWATVKGAGFGAGGQPNPSTYSVLFPSGVPDSVIDIQIISYDDLELATTSATVRVTKGAACTSDMQCSMTAPGQKCDGEGRCYWEPPAGALGDACTYNQYCLSNSCVETTDGKFCSEECVVGATDTCPMDYECVQNGAVGACIPAGANPDCCSVGRGRGSVWTHAGVSLVVLVLVVRRRRRRR